MRRPERDDGAATDGALLGASPAQVRERIARGRWTPRAFRAALTAVPPPERDAWVDAVLGLDRVPEDGPGLPRDGVPYLPAPVDALLRAAEHLGPGDVFVDVGAGVGRAAAVVHLLTGAQAWGVEIQPALVREARALAARLHLGGLRFTEGDATEAGELERGSVFFLYCPFSGARLDRLLERLEGVARRGPLLLCCVDVAPLRRPWLEALPAPSAELDLYRGR